jgi:hypothetical protein
MLYFSLHAINLHSPQPTLIPRFVRLLQVNERSPYFETTSTPLPLRLKAAQTPLLILLSRRDDGSTSS